MSDERIARDPFYDIKPERAWVGVSNMTEDRKLRVLLEINGIERVLFSSALPFDEGNVLQHSNITWLINSNKSLYDDELTRLRETLKVAREGLREIAYANLLHDKSDMAHARRIKESASFALARLDEMEGKQ